MIKLNKLKSVTKIVKEILTNDSETRNDDDLLYLTLCNILAPGIAKNSFSTVFLFRRNMGLPSFETVRRSRQKIQATYPELKGTKRVRKARKAKEKEYREYARESV